MNSDIFHNFGVIRLSSAAIKFSHNFLNLFGINFLIINWKIDFKLKSQE